MATRTSAKDSAKTSAKAKPAAAQPPWDRDNPKKAAHQPATHLTPAQKASAKRHAEAAGRPYPNLVDNMREAVKAKAAAAKRAPTAKPAKPAKKA